MTDVNTTQPKKKMGIGKVFGFGCLGLFVFFVLIGVAASLGGNKNSNTDKVSNSDTSNSTSQGSSSQTPAEAKPTEKITLSNATVSKMTAGIYKVDGEAKNNDSVEHTMTIKATFYDADGKILGTAVGALNSLASGDTKTYSLMSTDNVTGYKDFKVQVDTMF